MSADYNPNEPLHEGPDGTYITVAQMQFFLNRKNSLKKFQEADEDFLEYFNLCRIYNLVSDIMDSDPDAAIMYWDDKKKVVSFGFPTDGKVGKKLGTMKPVKALLFDDYQEDDEERDWFNDLWDEE